MRILLIVLATFLGFSAMSDVVQAASVSTEPSIVDIEGQRREEFRFDLSVTNQGPGVANAYPVVAEIDPDTGALSVRGTPAGAGRYASSWIRMQRDNLYLRAGQTKTVPVMVQLNVNAEPGVYHAVILFVDADSPEEAVTLADQQVARTMVNVAVQEDAVERLNLISFLTPQRLLFGFPSVLQATIMNGGNRALAPFGRIRILNRDDEEVGAVPFNAEEVTVPEDGEATISTTWEGNGGFGRYKAVLEMRYGNVTDSTVVDSTYFWVVPIWLIVALVGTALVLVLGLTHIVHRRTVHHAKR